MHGLVHPSRLQQLTSSGGPGGQAAEQQPAPSAGGMRGAQQPGYPPYHEQAPLAQAPVASYGLPRSSSGSLPPQPTRLSGSYPQASQPAGYPNQMPYRVPQASSAPFPAAAGYAQQPSAAIRYPSSMPQPAPVGGFNEAYPRPADFSSTSAAYMASAPAAHMSSSSSSSAQPSWPQQHQASGSQIDEREIQRKLAREKRQQEAGEATMSYASSSSKPQPSRASLPSTPAYPAYPQQQQQPYTSVGRTPGSRSPKRDALGISAPSSSVLQDSFKKQRVFSVPEKSHENLLKHQNEFRGQMSFVNTLPPVGLNPKLLTYRDRHDTETPSSELVNLRNEEHTPFIVERTLGVNLDLVDTLVYRPTVGDLDPEDEALLQITKKPSSSAASTSSSSSSSQHFANDDDLVIETTALGRKKPAKEESLRKMVGEVAALIEESFEAAKHPPTHATNPSLLPSEIWPVLPQIDLWPELVESVMFDPLPPTLASEAFGQCVLDTQQRRCVRFCAPSSLTPQQQEQIKTDGQGLLLEDARAYEEIPQRDEEEIEYLIAISDLQAGYVAVRKQRKLKRPNIEELKRFKENKRNVIVKSRDLATSERERRDRVLLALLQ